MRRRVRENVPSLPDQQRYCPTAAGRTAVAAMLTALRSSIGHLTARKINRRPPSDVAVDKVIEQALATGTFLEINSQPDRLDLRDAHARAAGEAGVLVAINSDAHQLSALAWPEIGVAQARRAWLTKEQILNTRSWRDLKKLTK